MLCAGQGQRRFSRDFPQAVRRLEIKRASRVARLGLRVGPKILPAQQQHSTTTDNHSGFGSVLHGTVMENSEAIKQNIFEKVQRRLTGETERDSIGKGITTGNTERYDRVFALWVSLQKAMQHRWGNETREYAPTPWNCQDTRVRKAWDALTLPRNEVALEILAHQLPEGPQQEMARKALQVCRERVKN